MKKKSEHSFSSVLTINPYTKEYFSATSNFLARNEAPHYAKDQYTISFLNTKSFIHTQISISKNIPEEDLYDALYNKMYDELALDQAVAYQMQYLETFWKVDEEHRYFHLFIVDPEELKETFKDITDAIKYIDTIIPSPLLFKTLYTKEIIEGSHAECFIYIEEHDASVTLYVDKEFLYTKSIKYSLHEIHERFCELYGEQIEYEYFKEFLEKTNLKKSDSPYRLTLIKIYKELFGTINEILTYIKRAYELDNINTLFIGSALYFESKLDEILEAELGIKSQVLEFDYNLESNESYIDQFHSLMYLYTTLREEERYQTNFTLFPRPPKFLKRPSGQIIAISAAALVLALIYPVTYWILAYMQDLRLELLKNEYTEIHTKRVTREATIKNKKAELEKTIALVKKEIQEFQEKKETLKKVKKVKNDYLMKAAALSELTKDLNSYRVKVDSILYEEENDQKVFTLHLVSSKSIKITKLLSHITKKYEERYHFDLDDIFFDPKHKLYFSTLKVTKL